MEEEKGNGLRGNKRRSTQEVANYYINNNPDAIFSKTLTGYLAEHIRKNPKQSYKEALEHIKAVLHKIK